MTSAFAESDVRARQAAPAAPFPTSRVAAGETLRKGTKYYPANLLDFDYAADSLP